MSLHTALSGTLQAADPVVEPVAGSAQLVLAALVGIAVIVVLIVQVKLHPFLSLTIGSFVVAIIAGEDLVKAIESYSTGFGDTAAGVAAGNVSSRPAWSVSIELTPM